MSDNRVFALQLRSITRVERMAIESFVAAGYDYTLYTYGDPQYLDAIPAPARYADAREILPREECALGTDGKASRFEQRFKFMALYMFGGLAVPTDYVVLRRLPEDAYLGVTAGNSAPQIDQPLRAPQYSWFARNMLRCMQEPAGDPVTTAELSWPLRGATLMSQQQAAPLSREHIVDHLLSSAGMLARDVLGLCLHRTAWEDRERTPGTRFEPATLYERLWNHFFGFGSDDGDDGSMEALFRQHLRRGSAS